MGSVDAFDGGIHEQRANQDEKSWGSGCRLACYGVTAFLPLRIRWRAFHACFHPREAQAEFPMADLEPAAVAHGGSDIVIAGTGREDTGVEGERHRSCIFE